jgi:hypothetical protein
MQNLQQVGPEEGLLSGASPRGGHPQDGVITPFGLWEFRRMLFGLRNAGQSFQRFMDQVFNGLDCAFVYLDAFWLAVLVRRSIFVIFARSCSGCASSAWS